jgi:hypothetical protein
MQITVFWDYNSCCLVEVYWRSSVVYCFHHQRRRIELLQKETLYRGTLYCIYMYILRSWIFVWISFHAFREESANMCKYEGYLRWIYEMILAHLVFSFSVHKNYSIIFWSLKNNPRIGKKKNKITIQLACISVL